MKHILDSSFRYTPVRDQSPDYLKKKFDRIRREQAARKEAEAPKPVGNVQALPRRVAK